ncbi:MAG: putative Ig domain-containing protein [Pseudomonadota bacterium]
MWGPDGRLYVTEVSGLVKVLTVAFGDPTPGVGDDTVKFYVTEAVTLNGVIGFNYDDDGSANHDVTEQNRIRQVTGIDVTQQYDGAGNPVLIDGIPAVDIYVTSSDPRHGAGSNGQDKNLDTNSGVIHRLRQTDSTSNGDAAFDTVDLVRGFARSEENHAINGLEVIQEVDEFGVLQSERLIVAVGGNANNGAPSNNFAAQQEYATSAAIFEVDLDMLSSMPVLTDNTIFLDDGNGGTVAAPRDYIYDLPTLDDPTRANLNGIDDPTDPGYDGLDATNPFGGNDGFNQSILESGGPIQMYSPGYRNSYDVEVTDDGRVWTYDNGANDSWGGRPIGEAGDDGGTTDFAQDPGYIATNLNNGDGNSNDEVNLVDWNPSNKDNFHEVTRSDDLDGRSLSVGGNSATAVTYVDPDTGFDVVYGGHPNPTRAEGAKAGLLYSPGGTDENAFLLVSDTNDEGNPSEDSDYTEVIAWFSAVEANDGDFPSDGIFGADAGELTKRVIEVTPGVLYDIYEAADGTGIAVLAGGPAPTGVGATLVSGVTGPIGLPADIHQIVENKNLIEGNYLEAGQTDGALDTGNGSINGLAEYTSTILDDGSTGTKMSGAILATTFNGGGTIIVMGRNADGTMSSNGGSNGAVASDRTVIDAAGGPLGLATIGDNIGELGLTNAFQGSIWAATYKNGGAVDIEVFQPEGVGIPLADTVPSNPNDQDGDGLSNVVDPFEFSVTNGYSLGVGEVLNLDFDAQSQAFAGSFSATGFLGAALDGTTPNQDAQTAAENFPVEFQRDGLFDDGGNIIPGGNADVFQIKDVQPGTVVGVANTARDAMQTGVNLSSDVKTLVTTANFKNWLPAASSLDAGQLTGLMFSDGTQSNFLRVVFGSVDFGGVEGVAPGIEVGFELGDAGYTTLAQIALPGLEVALNDTIDLRLAIREIGTNFAVAVEYKLASDADFTTVPLSGGSGFALPGGVLQDVLTGAYEITDGGTTLPSGAAIGILAETPVGTTLEAIDVNQITIEGRGNEIPAATGDEVDAPGTPEVDTIVYTGTDTVLDPLASDVENFDGTGSSADYAVTGNDLDNRIAVGNGANTVTTGNGSDTVVGALAQLAGDEITDLNIGDKVIFSDLTSADSAGAAYAVSAGGGAELTINGQTLILSGPDFASFDPTEASSVFFFNDGPEGLELTVLPPSTTETVVYRINFGSEGDIVAPDGGPAWVDEDSVIPGFSYDDLSNPFTTPAAALTVEYDNVDPTVVPEQVFFSERGDGDSSDGTPATLNFEVEVGKTYRIEYFYTENWQNIFGGGPRIFDVEIEGAVPAAFEGINPLADAEAFVGQTAAAAGVNNGSTPAAKDQFLNVARKAEYIYTAEDTQLNLSLIHDVQNPKINGIQISVFEDGSETFLVSIGNPVAQTEAGDTGTTPLVFALSVDEPGFTGNLILDFEVTVDGNTQTLLGQSVSFVDTAASITVNVPADIQNNGNDSVAISLTGVSGEAGNVASYAVNGAAATGTGSILEDDAPIAPAFPFDEATDGDLSDDRFTPTDLGALGLSDNQVTAIQQGDAEPGGRERDYFTFEVPEGQVLTELRLEAFAPGEPTLPQGFIGLAAGSQVLVDPETTATDIPELLGGHVYGPGDVGTNILPQLADGEVFGATTQGFNLPLPAGTYTLWMNQGGEASTITLNLMAPDASTFPNIGILDAADVIETGDIGQTDLVFPLSSTEPSITVDVTYTVNGGPEQTGTVTFDALGESALTVSVDNDDVFNGAESVAVALTSVTGENALIASASNAATGVVVEDETPLPTSPGQDFDGDTISNEDDLDIDGDGLGNSTSLDGVLNLDPGETFAYDTSNTGTALAVGETIRLEFDVDGTPFENGFTGALPSPNTSAPEVDLNNAEVSGGTLNIAVTKGDHFGSNNNQQNTFVAAYSVSEGLSVETRFVIPDFDSTEAGDQAPSNFQAAGVVVGVDQNNLVKAVWGRTAQEFELAQDNAGGGGPSAVTTGGSTTPAGAAEVLIRLEVFVETVDIDGTPTLIAKAQAFATFFDASGLAIPGFEEIAIGQIDLEDGADGNQLKTFVESGAPLGAGVIQTSVGDSAPTSFDVSYQYLEVAALGDIAPSVALNNLAASVPEDQDLAASVKVADIAVTDDDLSNVVLSLSGDDADLFEIVDNAGALELHIQADAALDFETNPQLDVTVEATDPGGTGTAAASIAVDDMNDAPTITGSIDAQETVAGAPTTVDLAALLLADEDVGDTPALRVEVGGVDVVAVGVAGFTLTGTTLEVDGSVAVGDYPIDVFANDGELDSETPVSFNLTVTAADVAPSVVLNNVAASVPEDQDLTASVKVADIVVTDDGLSPVTLGLTGDDADLFEIVDNAGALELHIQAGALLDFETNPQLDVTVEATDAVGTGTAAASIPVGAVVDDVAPSVLLSNVAVSVPEDQDLTASVKVADIAVTDDDLSNVVLSLSGDDADLFEIVDNAGALELHIQAGAALDFETNPQLDVTVEATDAVGTGTAAASIPVGDKTPPAPALAVALPPDASGDIVVTVDFGEPVFGFTPNGVTLSNTDGLARNDGSTSFVAGASAAVVTFAAPVDGFAQDQEYTASVAEGAALDGAGNASVESTSTPVTFAVDEAPIFVVAPNTIDLAENTDGVIATYEATDPDGDAVVYALDAAGLDRGFAIDSATGVLTAPVDGFNYEALFAAGNTTIAFNVIATSTAPGEDTKETLAPVVVEILDEAEGGASSSDDTFVVGEDQDIVILSNGGSDNGGADTVVGTSATLNEVEIRNFEDGDSFQISDATSDVEVVSLEAGSITVGVDTDDDGDADTFVEVSGSELTEDALTDGTLTTADFTTSGSTVTFAPVDETEPVVFEVEDFDDVFPISSSGPDQFFEENQSAASGGKVGRLATNSNGTATLTLASDSGVIFGQNDIAITYFDESDGVSSFTLNVDGSPIGTVTLNNDGGGNAAQSANLRTVTFEDVTVPSGAVVTIVGSSNGFEFVRLDKVAFTAVSGSPVGGENQSPIAVGTIDLSGLTQGDTINVPLEGAAPIFVDPDEELLTFSLSGNAPDFLSIDSGVLINNREITNDDVVASAVAGPVTVTVTASDGTDSATSSFDVAVANANDAPTVITENVADLDLVTSDTEITPIDASQFFSDADLSIPGGSEVLSYSAAGLPPELEIDPVTGAITGVLVAPGNFNVTVTATDGEGLQAAAQFWINATGEPVLGNPIRIQAEDFDNIADPGGFFQESQAAADENAVIRLGNGGNGEATLELAGVPDFTPGTYDIKLGFFDENDGDSTVTVKLRTFVEGVPTDEVVGEIVFNADNGGNAAQASSFREITLTGVTLPAGATFVLEGQAEGYNAAEAAALPNRTVGNEFVRIDFAEFIPVAGQVGNFAPFPVPGFDTALESPEGNASFDVLSAFGDPEEDVLTFSLTPAAGQAEVLSFLSIDPQTGVISMNNAFVDADTTFDFAVTATDAQGSGQSAFQEFSLLVTDEPLPTVTASVSANPTEGIPGQVTLDLVGDALADPVSVRLQIVQGDTAPAALPGLDFDFDGLGTTTVDVVIPAGGQGATALLFTDDGPIEAPESFKVEILAANIGSVIDAGAQQVPFVSFSAESVIADGDFAPIPVNDFESIFAADSFTFDPAGNDADADSSELTVTAIDTSTTEGGDVTLNVDGTVTIVADEDELTGDIVFGYTVSDESGNTADGTSTISIADDVLVSIEAAASAVEDGNTGTTLVDFVVTTTPATAGTVDVEYSLDGGVTTLTQTVTFDALGSGLLSVEVNGFNDAIDDGDDTATVTLVDAQTIGFSVDATADSGVATIVEDDTAGADVVVLRINSFGTVVTATDAGPNWQADTLAAPNQYLAVTDNRGDTFGYSGDPTAVPASVPSAVLDTARSSNAPFSYNIPVEDIGGAGVYRVNLYVAELFTGFQSGGSRNFDITVEGLTPPDLDDVDPGLQFGADVGVLSAEIAVTDGVLNIGFVQDVAQNPIINAIEVVQVGGDPSDTEGPTAAIELTVPVSTDDPLGVAITLTDTSLIDPATLGAEDIQLSIGGAPAAAAVTFLGFVGGVASYSIAAPAGGWQDGDDATVTLLEGQVADLAPVPNTNEAVSESVTLSITPPTEPDDAIAILNAAQGVDTDGVYSGGEIGSAELRIMENVNDVQDSNFSANSFILENTGDKQIAAVFIDFADAIYGDSVIDLDGSSGDTTAKEFGAQTGVGTTGVITEFIDAQVPNGFDVAQSYFYPGNEPNPDPSASDANGGFRGLLIRFDGSEGGFSNGEVLGFAGDMDPNSIATISKSAVDSGAINGWDVGGVSGAELIGSSFTVRFDDGTFATGILGSNGTQAGATGKATQTLTPDQIATVTVNGASAGTQGVYGGTVPEIVVDGPAGATVLVTLSKGLNPVTNSSGGVAQSVADRLSNSQPDFQVNNAADFQTFQITLDGSGMATLPPAAFDYNAPDGGESFSGSAFTSSYETAPIVVATSVVNSDGQPLGPVDRVYLISNGTAVSAGPDTAPSVAITNALTSVSADQDLTASFKVADIVVTDDGLSPVTLGLIGNDASLFEIVDNAGALELHIQAGAALDFETNPQLDVTVEATDAVGTGTAAASIPISDVVDDVVPSVVLNNVAASVPEDQDLTASFKVADIVVIDDGQSAVTTALSGADAGLFTIVDNGGALELHVAAGVALDFASNPQLDVTVEATDAVGIGSAAVSIAVEEESVQPADGFFNGIGNPTNNFYFKVQMEDPNGINGGQNPGGKWTFVDAPDANGNQAGFEGDGYYLFGSETSTAIDNAVNGNELIEYNIFIPPGAEGTYKFGISVARDGQFANDQQNDVWVGFKKAGTNETIGDYLVQDGSSPQPTQGGFIKVFGGPNDGNWGTATKWDGNPNNEPTEVEITEPGVYTIQIDGRSQGYHIDFWTFWKGLPPEDGAPDSTFESVGDTEPTVTDPIDDVTLQQGTGTTIDAAAAFQDIDGDDLDFTVSGPPEVTIDFETGLLTVADTLALGSYDVTVTAVDDDGNSVDDLFVIDVLDSAPPLTVSYTISSSAGDWEEFGGAGSGDLELGQNGAQQFVGLRFTGVEIPDGATVTNAFIRFSAQESNSANAEFNVSIENSETAAPYTTANDPGSASRDYIDEFVWNPEPWTEGQEYDTPNLADLINNVIGTDGVSNGSLGFFFDGVEGSRVADTFNTPGGDEPELFIEYILF